MVRPVFAPEVLEDAAKALEDALEKWDDSHTPLLALLEGQLQTGSLELRRAMVALDEAAIADDGGYFDWLDLETSEIERRPELVARVIRKAIELARDPHL
jgi:hypothetical protein